MSAVARPTVVYNKMHSSQSRQTKDALEHDGIKICMPKDSHTNSHRREKRLVNTTSTSPSYT